MVGARALLGTGPARKVLDLFGLDEATAQDRHPAEYQRLWDSVRPERAAKAGRTNDVAQYGRLWWVFGKPRPEFRKAAVGLARFIATVETSRARWFTFVSADALPEQTLVAIALDDASLAGVLSSRVHVSWAMALGSRLGVGNDSRYTIARCFDPFPFPAATEEQKARIRELGEALDAHRKRQQAAHPDLTLTGMYNVLEKLRAGEPLTKKEQTIHEQGLCSVLLKIHDDLDAAVFAAYGWPADLSDEEILERLVGLNAERAEEERRGLVRWLRPEFQCPEAAGETQAELEGIETEAKNDAAAPAAKKGAEPWPTGLVARVQAVQAGLEAAAGPLAPADLARTFKGARIDAVAEILETLATVGQARRLEDGRYTR